MSRERRNPKTIHRQRRGSFQEAVLCVCCCCCCSSPRPHLTALMRADSMISSFKVDEALAGGAQAVIPADNSTQKAGLHRDMQPALNTPRTSEITANCNRGITTGCFTRSDSRAGPHLQVSTFRTRYHDMCCLIISITLERC